MNVTLNIQVAKSSLCDSMVVTDITPWTGTAPDDRDDYGLALFVKSGTIGGSLTIDTSLCDLSNPGDSTYQGSWTVPTTNNKEFQFYVFAAPDFETGVSPAYNGGDIVYYDGNFYVYTGATTGDPGSPASWIAADWTILSEASFTTFTSAVGLAVPIVTQDDTSAIMDCAVLSNRVDDCHSWVFTSDGLDLNAFMIEVYNLDGESLSKGITSDATLSASTTPSLVQSTCTSFYIDFSEDGVYYVKLYNSDGDTYYLPVYDFCSTRTCALSLLKSILCNCDDPCDTDDCDQTTVTRYRQEINRIIALYFPLIGMVKSDLTQYMGILEIDEDRQHFMLQISNILDQLRVVIDRCGTCSDDSTSDTSDCDC